MPLIQPLKDSVFHEKKALFVSLSLALYATDFTLVPNASFMSYPLRDLVHKQKQNTSIYFIKLNRIFCGSAQNVANGHNM